MRTSPLIGEKAWFGPRRIGWGLSPRSTAGWISTFVAVAASIFTVRMWPTRRVIRFIPIAAYIIVAFLKGTSPGGTKARRKLADHNS